jgi:hypothetical protein
MLFIVWGAMAIAVAISMATTTSCTLSYQTICTHGTTSDVADEQQEASPTVEATANVSGMPPLRAVITGPTGPKG